MIEIYLLIHARSNSECSEWACCNPRPRSLNYDVYGVTPHTKPLDPRPSTSRFFLRATLKRGRGDEANHQARFPTIIVIITFHGNYNQSLNHIISVPG